MALHAVVGVRFLALKLSKQCCISTTLRYVEPVHIQAARCLSQNEELPRKPKRPTTPFVVFAEKMFNSSPERNYSKILKDASKEWANMSDEDKTQYYDTYKERFAKYKEEMKTYQPTEEETEAQRKKKAREQRRLTLKKLAKLGKPKLPGSSYSMYVREKMKSADSKGRQKEVMIEASTDWKFLTEEEKQPYKDIFLQEKKRYMNEMEVWEKKMIKLGNNDLVRRKTKQPVQVLGN
ncbi:transcription factor A, mitochondrial-like [Saccoglossus kowalevskii]